MSPADVRQQLAAELHALADDIATGIQPVPAVSVVYDGTTRMRVVPRVIHDLLCAVRVATPQETTPVVLGCAGCGFCYPQAVTQ